MAPNYSNESISLFIIINRNDYEKSISPNRSPTNPSPTLSKKFAVVD